MKWKQLVSTCHIYMCKWLVSQIVVWHSEWCCHSAAVMHSGRSMDLEVTFTLMEFPVFVYSFAGTWTGIFFSIQSINLKFDLTCCVVVVFFLIRLLHVSTWLSWNVVCLVSVIKLVTWVTILSVWKWGLVQYKDERECRPWHGSVHAGFVVDRVAVGRALLQGLKFSHHYHSTHA